MFSSAASKTILLGAFVWHIGFGLADVSMPGDVLGLIEHGGSLVILAWVIFHVLTKTIPALQKDNKSSREESVAALKTIQESHVAVVDKLNESMARRNERTSESLDRLAEAVRRLGEK